MRYEADELVRLAEIWIDAFLRRADTDSIDAEIAEHVGNYRYYERRYRTLHRRETQ